MGGSDSSDTCTVSLQRTRQKIDGFGICQAFHQADHVQSYPEPLRTEILDLLFSPESGAGFSIIRNIIGDGGTWGNALDGPTPTIEPSQGVWNWSGDEAQIWITKEAIARGCQKVFAAAWSPPAWMKTNGSVTNGGSLRPEMYRAFAEYLSRYVTEYKAKHGIDIYAISPANEPDMSMPYSSCLWTGEELARFIADHVGPVFERDHVRAKLVMPETEHFGLERASYFTPALQNPSASSVIGILAQHGYGGRIEHLGLPEGLGKSIWLSEICTTVKESNDSSMVDGIRWARSIHDYLTIPEVSAYCYFWGASLYYSGAISLVGLNLEDKQIVRNKRLFVIGNYSRFVRPGYLRIEVTPSSSASVPLTAFTDADRRKVVLVAFNEKAAARSIAVSVQGISNGAFECFRTSETENLDRLSGVSCTGGVLRATLPPLSVSTLVGP